MVGEFAGRDLPPVLALTANTIKPTMTLIFPTSSAKPWLPAKCELPIAGFTLSDFRWKV